MVDAVQFLIDTKSTESIAVAEAMAAARLSVFQQIVA